MFRQNVMNASAHTMVEWVQGNLYNPSTDSTKYVTSQPIEGGHTVGLKVKGLYRILALYLTAPDGQRYYHNVSTSTGRQAYGTEVPKGYTVQFIVERIPENKMSYSTFVAEADKLPITPDDDFVRELMVVDHLWQQPDESEADSRYTDARLAMSAWHNTLPRMLRASKGNAQYGEGRGVGMAFSVPYGSGPVYCCGVDPESYMTAMRNPRSVVYTEFTYPNPTSKYTQAPLSEYGMEGLYQPGNDNEYKRYYYAMVCNTATAIALGFVPRIDESQYSAQSSIVAQNNVLTGTHTIASTVIASYTALTAETAKQLRPLDVLVEGAYHILVVVRTIKDAEGNVRWIEMFESNYDANYYLTDVEGMKNEMQYHHNALGKVVRTRAMKALYEPYAFSRSRQWSPTEPEDDYTPYDYSQTDNICTFLGDRVEVSDSDPLWLNIRTRHGATGQNHASDWSIDLQREYPDTGQWATVHTLTAATYTVPQGHGPFSYTLDRGDGEVEDTYIDVRVDDVLRQLQGHTYNGHYRAVLHLGADEAGATYWETLKFDIDYVVQTQTQRSYIATFHVETPEAVRYAYAMETNRGGYLLNAPTHNGAKYNFLTAEELASGITCHQTNGSVDKTTQLADGTTPADHLVLALTGRYGTVAKSHYRDTVTPCVIWGNANVTTGISANWQTGYYNSRGVKLNDVSGTYCLKSLRAVSPSTRYLLMIKTETANMQYMRLNEYAAGAVLGTDAPLWSTLLTSGRWLSPKVYMLDFVTGDDTAAVALSLRHSNVWNSQLVYAIMVQAPLQAPGIVETGDGKLALTGNGQLLYGTAPAGTGDPTDETSYTWHPYTAPLAAADIQGDFAAMAVRTGYTPGGDAVIGIDRSDIATEPALTGTEGITDGGHLEF